MLRVVGHVVAVLMFTAVYPDEKKQWNAAVTPSRPISFKKSNVILTNQTDAYTDEHTCE